VFDPSVGHRAGDRGRRRVGEHRRRAAAVPTVAFINSAMRVLLASDPAAEEAELEAQDGPIVTAEADNVAEP